MSANSPGESAHVAHFVSSASRALTHGLTQLCVGLAIVAIIAFVSQSWPLILFALGVYSVLTYLIRAFR